MKRIGHLWPSVIERGNLLRAFHQAARGKRNKIEVRRFALDLDGNLDELRRQLENRTFETGKFNVFKVFDPKERTIHAARFPERVVPWMRDRTFRAGLLLAWGGHCGHDGLA